MSVEQNSNAQIEVEAGAHQNSNFLSPDVTMLVLTWVTFFLLLAVLYKFAWKPILSALDRREEALRKSVEEAEKVKEELIKINDARQKMLMETEIKSKEILLQSRKEAVEVAKALHEKAKDEAKILLENAKREITEEAQKAQTQLRDESVRIAVGLATKLVEKNLSDNENQKIVADFIKDL